MTVLNVQVELASFLGRQVFLDIEARYRLNPFIVITLVSIGLALLAGMPPSGVVGANEARVGKTLGHIALVVALGTMLGKMIAGGAEMAACGLGMGGFGAARALSTRNDEPTRASKLTG